MIRLQSNDPNATSAFRDCLDGGGLAVYPTDTLYGLGTAVDNGAAIARLEILKGRGGPFSIMLGSLLQLERILLVQQEESDKIRPMSTGSYAWVGPARNAEQWQRSLLGSEGTLSVRIGNHPWLAALFTDWDKMMLTTSANRTGEPALQDPEAIAAQLGGEIDLLIDGGKLAPSGGSTMVKFGQGQWQLLRQGDGPWPA